MFIKNEENGNDLPVQEWTILIFPLVPIREDREVVVLVEVGLGVEVGAEVEVEVGQEVEVEVDREAEVDREVEDRIMFLFLNRI